jgi:hypothetical protein
MPRRDSAPIAERPETWGPELVEDPIEASQCCSVLKFASALSDPERPADGVFAAASPQRFLHLATAFRRNAESVESSALSVPAHVVDTTPEVAPEPSSSRGKGRACKRGQAEEQQHKTPRPARKSKGAKGASLVLENFFQVRKRICLDRDEKPAVSDDHTAEANSPASLTNSVSDLPAFSEAAERSLEASEHGANRMTSDQDARGAELMHDQLKTHEELSAVEVGCHVDVKAKVDRVGKLQIQELPLQPGESTAIRNITLRFQDNSLCEWRLWGGDAEKHSDDELRSREVIVTGAKLYKFNGKISLNGCTAVKAL